MIERPMPQPGTTLLEKRTVIALIAFYLAFMLAYLHHQRIILPTLGEKIYQHEEFLANQAPNPYQYRFMLHWVTEGFKWAASFAMPPEKSFVVAQALTVLLSTWLALYAFQHYLRIWFDAVASFGGMILLAAVQPLTYFNYHYLPTSYPAQLFFILGFLLILENRRLLLGLLLFISIFNRMDTPAFLIVLYFLCQFNLKDRAFWLTVIVYGICFFFISWLFRFVCGFNPMIRDFLFYPVYNLKTLGTVLVAVIFGPFWIWSAMGLRGAPRFLKRAFWFVPIVLAIHFFVAKINEVRYFLPLAPVVIPLSFGYLLGWKNETENQRS